MEKLQLMACAALWSGFGTASSYSTLVVVYWDHTHHQPAALFRAGLVVDAAEGHCKAKQRIINSKWINTNEYILIHTNTSQYKTIHSNTIQYMFCTLPFFAYQYIKYIPIHTNTYQYIQYNVIKTNTYQYISIHTSSSSWQTIPWSSTCILSIGMYWRVWSVLACIACIGLYWFTPNSGNLGIPNFLN